MSQSGEEGESIKLGAACNELELVWVVGSCAAGRHWCEVDCMIDGDYVYVIVDFVE